MVNALVLVNASDPEKKRLLYACANCGQVHSHKIYLAPLEVAHEAARKAAENCYNCREHNTCSSCGENCSKRRTVCDPCYDKKQKEEWLAMPVEEWDEASALYSQSADEYFFDEDSLNDYLEDEEGRTEDGLRLIICEPNTPRLLDSDFWHDDLADGHTIEDHFSKETLAAIDHLNKLLEKEGPMSWYPGKKRPAPILTTKEQSA